MRNTETDKNVPEDKAIYLFITYTILIFLKSWGWSPGPWPIIGKWSTTELHLQPKNTNLVQFSVPGLRFYLY